MAWRAPSDDMASLSLALPTSHDHTHPHSPTPTSPSTPWDNTESPSRPALHHHHHHHTSVSSAPPPHPPPREIRYEFSLAPGPEFDTDSAPENEHDQEGHQLDQSVNATAAAAAAAAAAAERNENEPSSRTDTFSPTQSHTPSIERDHTQDAHLRLNNLSSSTPPPSKPTSNTAARTATPPARRRRGGAASAATGVRGGVSKRASTAGGATASSAGALSHTKLCRDRLNDMFERLRTTLPAAPAGVEVKHKAQVLDYAINVLKNMVRRTSELEIELAVSSHRATMDWVSSLVSSTPTFTAAARDVMRVFCRRRRWRAGELWLTSRDEAGEIRLCFGELVAEDGEGVARVRAFSDASRNITFAPEIGVQGRVWASMRPEWLAGLNDEKTFVRAPIAAKYGVKTCLAVPVTITGKIEAVICFYDVRHRPYDSTCLDLAMRLTWALGNATGGKRAQLGITSRSADAK